MVTAKCLQYLCFAYNVLYCITGCLLVICSSILIYRVLIYRHFIHHEIIDPFWILFGTGLGVIFTTWVGWKIARRAHRLHVILFFVVILFVMIVECSAAIWSFVEYHRFHSFTKIYMERSLNNYQHNKNDVEASNAWERIQTEMRCCGYDGPMEYKKDLPRSCCVSMHGTDGEQNSSCAHIYQRGCVQIFIDYLKKQLLYNTALGGCAFLLQICGLFCYFHFAKELKRDAKQTAQILENGDSLLNRRTSYLTRT